jgi:MtN3 and saliva related transmembrane protein
MAWIEIVGHTAAFLSSITSMPQVYKVWKTISVGDLSLAMMLIVFSSTLVWLVYGVKLNLWPVIICNGIIAILSLLLIYFKFAYQKN